MELNHVPTFQEFVENLLTTSFLEASSTWIKHSLFTLLPPALNLTFFRQQILTKGHFLFDILSK